MRKLIKYFKAKGDAGLSLIELIISMAILAVVGLAVGGAMYVSSRSYATSSTEVNVQEEAQVTSSLICDWLVDATEVNPTDGEVTLATDGSNDFVIVHPDGDASVNIRIYLDGTDLKYDANKSTTQDDGTVVNELSSGTLASNVYGVVFNSTFGSDRNVKFSMDFKVNDRNYNAVTDSTSRNHSFVSTAGNAVAQSLYILPDNGVYTIGPDEYQVILEPGQRLNGASYDASYNFTFQVFGFDAHTKVLLENSEDSSKTKGGATLTYSQISGTNQFTVNCQSADDASGDQVFTFKAVNDSDASINHSITVHVSIRKVTKFDIAYAGGTFKTSGNEGEDGSTYAATFDLGVQYGAQVNAGFDKNGGYRNPYKVVYFYKEKDGSNFNTIDPNAYFEDLVVDEGLGGTPGISFKLKNDISKDVYIVAVAAHSGDLPNLGATNAGVIFNNNPITNYTNRVTSVKSALGTYSAFSYGPSGRAYFGVLKITATTPHNDDFTLPNPSAIRRGIPSFEIARITDSGYTTLESACNAWCSNHGYTSPTNAGMKFKSVVWYREQGTSTWNYYVMHSPAQLSNMKDHETTQFQNANESYIFAGDKSYDYYVAFYAWAPTGELVKELKSAVNQVPASVPYVYDPTDRKFKMETYDSDSPMVFDASDYRASTSDPGHLKNYDFYVYFSNMTSANAESTHITWTIDRWDPTANHGAGAWVPDNQLVIWKQGLESIDQINNSNTWGIGASGDSSKYHTGSGNYIGSIVLGGADNTTGTTLQIGPYNENRYPDANMSVARLEIDKKYILGEGSTTYNGRYRLSFGGTNSYQAPTGLNPGQVTYNGSNGSVSGTHTVDCDLTGTSVNGAEYGYIYFTIQP